MCLPLRAEEHKLEFFVYSAKIWEGTCKHKVIGLKMYHMPFGHSVNRTKCKKKKEKGFEMFGGGSNEKVQRRMG